MSKLKTSLIKTEADYKTAIDRIDQLFDARPDSVESDELDVLLLKVDAYQRQNKRFSKASPIEVIRFMMEQQGLKQVDLFKDICSESQVSKMLRGKGHLTVDMIRNLSEKLHIPLEAIQD